MLKKKKGKERNIATHRVCRYLLACYAKISDARHDRELKGRGIRASQPCTGCVFFLLLPFFSSILSFHLLTLIDLFHIASAVVPFPRRFFVQSGDLCRLAAPETSEPFILELRSVIGRALPSCVLLRAAVILSHNDERELARHFEL